MKDLFRDLKFPKTRGFQFKAFLSGFSLGVEIALGAVTGGFTVALTKAIKEGVKVGHRQLLVQRDQGELTST